MSRAEFILPYQNMSSNQPKRTPKPPPQKKPEYRGRKQKINGKRGPKCDPIENPKFTKKISTTKDKRALLSISLLQHSF